MAKVLLPVLEIGSGATPESLGLDLHKRMVVDSYSSNYLTTSSSSSPRGLVHSLVVPAILVLLILV